ncbi:hypothetical protein evm_013457 [Chilo suppressalis]|nr:hypothetical protein evm_013457 [Chilo suppressalis]
MGKLPYAYTDSDEETSSSVENVKKKKKLSILKCSTGNLKKKKCKFHAKSEPDDSDSRSRSRSHSNHRFVYKLHGILKNDKEKEYVSTDDDEDVDLPSAMKSQDRCLVGRVPRLPGAKPGRGGGLAIVVRKNVSKKDLLVRDIRLDQAALQLKNG